MDARTWLLAQQLFHAAAELTVEEQAAFVAAAAADDPPLARELAAMLEEDGRPQSLVHAGLETAAQGVFGPAAWAEDGAFGPYRLTSLLGEGGMGVVYKAERADLGSTAAIKILRDAWLSPSRRTRFVTEQRTLARLRHPAIATLYDADALADGTPWFAMEYVEGEPITAYCVARVGDLHRRLALFLEVCAAVQYAHEQLVVHRDLKPSNILVNADGQVKLLDFGIARQLDEHARPADRTLTVLRAMTPAYASPQQIRGDAAGVDTDVYSLGVILYELLTGRLPFDMAGLGPAQAERLVTEGEPARPSGLSDARATGRVGRAAWADLDVLCLTAMHRDVQRRYRTVDALMRDVEHLLRAEPLEARPDTLAYRTSTFVRRNRLPLSIVASATGALAGVVGLYTFRLRRARNHAMAEAGRALRIQQFMLRLFEGGEAVAGPAEELRVITLIDRGVLEANALTHEPMVQAELYQTLGHLCQKLGQFDRADTLFTQAISLRRSLFGDASSEVVDTMVAQAGLLTEQARFNDALVLATAAVDLATSVLPAGHPLRAAATRVRGRVLQERGEYELAIPVLERAVAMLDADDDTLELAESLHEAANAHFYAGHLDASEALNRRTLAIYQRLLGETHPHVADTFVNLGAIAFERGDDETSERLFRQALTVTEAWYGPLHFRTAANLVMLGRTLTRRNKLDEAGVALTRALAGREQAHGPAHPAVASVLNELGTIARKQGRLGDAEQAYSRMAGIYRQVHGERGHYLNGIAASNLGGLALARGDVGEGQRLLQDAIEIFTATQGRDHVNTAIARVKLAGAYNAGRRYEEARREATEAQAILARTMAADAVWMVAVGAALTTARQALSATSGGAPEPAAHG